MNERIILSIVFLLVTFVILYACLIILYAAIEDKFYAALLFFIVGRSLYAIWKPFHLVAEKIAGRKIKHSVYHPRK